MRMRGMIDGWGSFEPRPPRGVLHHTGDVCVQNLSQFLEPLIAAATSFSRKTNSSVVRWKIGSYWSLLMASAEKEVLFKFPRTRHLFDAGGSGVSRDDLLLDEGEEALFYSGRSAGSRARGRRPGAPAGRLVCIEEKVDGANLGISVGEDLQLRVQNRSHFVNSKTHAQFSTLDSWLEENSAALYELLESRSLVLFGEWLYAKHSIHYTRLPGYFMAFDLFDKSAGKFFSWRERNRRLEGTGIPVVRRISETTIDGRKELLKWLDTKSAFYDGPVEGVYLRIDGDAPDQTTSSHVYNEHRGKVVRPDFMQGIVEQWTRQQLTKNIVTFNTDYE